MNLNQNQNRPSSMAMTKSSNITKSCQNLLCLTSRCYEEDRKQKQKSLNLQYFQKLSLKKFNQNSTILNQSIHQKQHKQHNKNEDLFQNINIKSSIKYNQRQKSNFHDGNKYSLIEQNIPLHQINPQLYVLNDSRRIYRSSSQRILTRPVQNTDRSMEQQLEFQYKRIQDLEGLRKNLQKQIKNLDQSIDKYYCIYNDKLNQLKKIQNKMKQIQREKQLQTKPSQQEKSFKKKSYIHNPSQKIYSNHQNNQNHQNQNNQNQNHQNNYKLPSNSNHIKYKK